MILGIDPGSRRVGVAIADTETRFARPLEVIDVNETDPTMRIAELVGEHGVSVVVVGRPTSLSGRAGPAVDVQQAFVDGLRAVLEVSIVEHDERLTTVLADQGLRAAGGSQKARAAQRDAVAAQVMLQSYLDASS
ncbi:MAG TPA: Holliday junction resolvase RuvX [Actinomycetota bacterium]|nr:Holliday junction resolvase RuvX [Actinomycetota bacterium]